MSTNYEVPYESLMLILDITKVMNYEKNMNKLLVYISEQACKVINTDRCSIFLVDKVSNDLYSKVTLKEEKEIRVKKGQGIVGHVFNTGKSLIIPDAYNDIRFHRDTDLITGYKTRNILSVPIRNINNDIIGVFEMINKLDDMEFTAIDVALMDVFSSHAAIAIENSIWYNDSIKKERMKMYIPESLVQSIEDEISHIDEGTEVRTITSMFLDIRAFTHLTKELKMFDIINILKNLFTDFEKIIKVNGGEINKFLGDGFFAIFYGNNGLTTTIKCINSCFDIIESLKVFNKRHKKLIDDDLKIGIGVATGEVIYGNIGGVRRGDYSVIGECVNISAKLEKVAKLGKKTNIAVSRETYDMIKGIYDTKKIDNNTVGAAYEVIKPVSAKDLEKILIQKSYKEYGNVIEYIGMVHNEDFLETLIKLYKDETEEIKIKILNSISNFENIGSDYTKNLKDYFYQEKNEKIKAKIITTIGQIGTVKDVEFLENCLNEKDSRLKSDAFESVWKYYSLGKIIEIIKDFSESDNRAKASASIILSKFDIVEAVKIIREMIFSNNSSMKFSGCYALSKIAKTYDADKQIYKMENLELDARKEAGELTSIMIPRVIEILCDLDDKIVENVIITLGALRDKRALFPLVKLLDSIEKKYVKTIINAITNIGIDEVVYHLILKSIGSR